MALYKYLDRLQQTNHINFDTARSPGESAPDAGIYQCLGCGDEIGIAKGHTLAPQNHHQHTSGPPVLWKLIVAATSIV